MVASSRVCPWRLFHRGFFGFWSAFEFQGQTNEDFFLGRHGPAVCRQSATRRKMAAFGKADASAMRTRLVVSVILAATLTRPSRKVVNSA